MKPLTPVEIVAELDRHIVGQERAKRAVAVALRNRWRAERAAAQLPAERSHHRYLVSGPRGIGKSATIRCAVDCVEAPFVAVSAYQFAAESSPARAAQSVLESLVDFAACQLSDATSELAARAAEHTGIIVIDGLDSWPSSASDEASDEIREHIQRTLYHLTFSPRIETRYGTLDTRHMLMFASGLIASSRPADVPHDLQLLFPSRIELDPLGDDDLQRILCHPESSPIHAYVTLLNAEGLHVHFTSDALEAIAAEAGDQNRKGDDTGAHRLAPVIENVLDDLLYDPSTVPGGELTIDAAYVTERLAVEGEDEDLDDFIL